MSYVDEVIELVVKKNPAEPEFHQAVKEVLESLRAVVEANEEKFRRDALLEKMCIRDRACRMQKDTDIGKSRTYERMSDRGNGLSWRLYSRRRNEYTGRKSEESSCQLC